MTSSPGNLALIGNKVSTLLRFRGHLIRAWVARGLRVHAIVPGYDEAGRDSVRSLGAEPVELSLNRTGLNPVRDTVDILRLARLLRELRADTVFCYFIKPVIYGSLAARLAGITRCYAMVEGAGYVFIEGAGQTASQRVLRNLVEKLYRMSLSRVERVFMLNQDDVELFVTRGLVDRNKVVQLDGIGVDLAGYPHVAPVTRPLTFLLVARLLTEKGIAEYLQAALQVKAHHPDVRFLLVGGLDQNPGCLNAAEVHRWVDRGVIEWPGEVCDVRPWMQQASVFVLPSWREGLPRSTQEAMAMGRAVITTNVPGCRETVIPNINGYLVPVRRPQALADAMCCFVNNPQRVTAMGCASRRIAEQRFDVRKINNQILNAMQIPL